MSLNPWSVAGEETSSAEALSVIVGRARPVGNITVARSLPVKERRHVGPFVFLDHMGPITLPPGDGFDVAPHPHIGLSTLTYLFEGDIVHRDSLGSVQPIVPGDVNLMTAGRGVVHSERSSDASRAAGSTLHGLQLWIALTEEDETREPTFVHAPKPGFPRSVRDGVAATVILGDFLGLASSFAHRSKPRLVDLVLDPGAELVLADGGDERAVYVVLGSVQIAGRDLEPRSLAVIARGSTPTLRAREASRVVLLGGPDLGPRFIDWNFVSSSRSRILEAKAAWRAETFPTIPGDDQERIPLPSTETR
jgi:redox-sensitive bicupin YhaK (pirin superfamily)